MKTQVFHSILQPAVILLGLAFARELSAQQVTVLTNVKVIDGTGAPMQSNKTVVIEGDRIRSIGSDVAGKPNDAKTIDMDGQTIMPLITNTHGHLGMVKGTASCVSN